MGSIQELQAVAKERGGLCISKKYYGNNIKHRWQCQNDHIWEATAGNVKSGKWCSICAGVQAHTIEAMHGLAKIKGGSCLSTFYVNRRQRLLWQCEEGHTWITQAASVIEGKWCPVCGIIKRSDSLRADIKEIKAIAQERGGKCLSQKYERSNEKLLWQCFLGHQWEAVLSSIKNGGWCPECSAGIGERICRIFMEQLFGEEFPKSRPRWLKSPEGTQLELDGYCMKLNLAFEHQGSQHFVKNDRFDKLDNSFERRFIFVFAD